MSDNERRALSQHNGFIFHVLRAIHEKLRTRFPGSHDVGVAFGIDPVDNERLNLISSEKEREQELIRSLRLHVRTPRELSDEEKEEIYKLVGERFINFLVGKVELH